MEKGAYRLRTALTRLKNPHPSKIPHCGEGPGFSGLNERTIYTHPCSVLWLVAAGGVPIVRVTGQKPYGKTRVEFDTPDSGA